MTRVKLTVKLFVKSCVTLLQKITVSVCRCVCVWGGVVFLCDCPSVNHPVTPYSKHRKQNTPPIDNTGFREDDLCMTSGREQTRNGCVNQDGRILGQKVKEKQH